MGGLGGGFGVEFGARREENGFFWWKSWETEGGGGGAGRKNGITEAPNWGFWDSKLEAFNPTLGNF